MSEDKAPYNPPAFPQPMIESPQGGIAFPVHFGDLGDGGMTLRDWFAGQAMQSLASHSWYANQADDGGWEYAGKGLASDAYTIADAMLRERMEPGKPSISNEEILRAVNEIMSRLENWCGGNHRCRIIWESVLVLMAATGNEPPDELRKKFI